jgi:hypothetical protein
LTRRIRTSPGTGPHMSVISRTAGGAVSTTACPPRGCRRRAGVRRRRPRSPARRRAPRYSTPVPSRPAHRHVPRRGQHIGHLGQWRGQLEPDPPCATGIGPTSRRLLGRSPPRSFATARPGRGRRRDALDQHGDLTAPRRRRRSPARSAPPARPDGGQPARPGVRRAGRSTAAAGRGCRRNAHSVISPSVPYEPVKSLPRSYPATFLTTLPPACATCRRAGPP